MWCLDNDTDMSMADQNERRQWMAVLAGADRASLEQLWQAETVPDFAFLRAPETGLVMVRGRAGGTGAPFNIGEATVTRCAVRLTDGTVGHAYVMGTDRRHAEIAALCDAMLQRAADQARLMARLIAPLKSAGDARKAAAASRAAATKVDFFTMVRGDG